MLKWLTALYHHLTSTTAGVALTKLKATAEADYKASLNAIEQTYAKDLAVVEALGHKELDALKHLVEAAQARIHALLESEVDLGPRNVDAAVLHTNLTKAIS